MSEEAYFGAVKKRFDEMGIPLERAPENGQITEEMLKNSGGIFVGGGHTYTLLDKLQKSGSLDVIRKAVEEGLPYMGSSAGTVIACPTIKTTNDMPGPAADTIDLKALGLIGFQINPHYMDNSMHDPKHIGETRDTRLKEISAFNPGMQTLGLYEGQVVRVNGDKTEILTSLNNRGTKPPVFHVVRAGADCTRTEIECEVGVPQDVSRIFIAN
jgi:dipeptidase E